MIDSINKDASEQNYNQNIIVCMMARNPQQAWQEILTFVKKKSNSAYEKLKNQGSLLVQKIRLNGCDLHGSGSHFLGQTYLPEAKIIILYGNNLDYSDMQKLIAVRWPSIAYLDLNQNSIGSLGVKCLSMMAIQNLLSINLRQNRIGDEGAKYMSQANWPLLSQMMLQSNEITEQGVKYLTMMKSQLISYLMIGNNSIKNQGLSLIVKSKWRNITTLFIGNNQINQQGAYYFSESKWKNIQKISFTGNTINSKSIKYLVMSDWPYLQQIILNSNNHSQNAALSFEAVKSLSKSKWPNLKALNLNSIKPCKQFMSILYLSNWPVIKRINLYDDGIQSVQICQFSTLDCCDLVEIDLANNKINDAGIVWKQVYKKFNKLRTVNFNNNLMSPQVQQQLESLIQ